MSGAQAVFEVSSCCPDECITAAWALHAAYRHPNHPPGTSPLFTGACQSLSTHSSADRLYCVHRHEREPPTGRQHRMAPLLADRWDGTHYSAQQHTPTQNTHTQLGHTAVHPSPPELQMLLPCEAAAAAAPGTCHHAGRLAGRCRVCVCVRSKCVTCITQRPPKHHNASDVGSREPARLLTAAAGGRLTGGVGTSNDLTDLLCDLCLASLVELHQQHLHNVSTAHRTTGFSSDQHSRYSVLPARQHNSELHTT